MRAVLLEGWRGRRVVLAGGADGLCLWMQAMLGELGARVVRIGVKADAQTLCRALSAGRTSALIVPCAHQLAGGDAASQLASLRALLGEAREAGVPLVMLLSDEDVYLRGARPYPACEDDALGGATRGALAQAILQLYALGEARGLMGDAIGVLCVRHMPALGCGHPAVAQYGAWCDALLAGDMLTVEHPSARGIFVHPPDIAAGALCIGAHHLASGAAGACNIGTDERSLIPNRSAAMRLVTSRGGTRPLREIEPPRAPLPGPLDGAKARRLGVRTRVDAADALSLLLDLHAARARGELAACMARQTAQYLTQML